MVFVFDLIELDPNNYVFKVDGEVRPIEPKVFDLIVFLLNNRERLVSRQELFEVVWAGRAVGDATLSNHIKMARAAVGDDGEQQRVIKTVRGRGYQFIAQLREPPPTPLEAPSAPSQSPLKTTSIALKNRKGLLAGIVVALTIVLATTLLFPRSQNSFLGGKSIAVLPFENRSELTKDEFFTDGIHDDLLIQISKITEIRTISRSSVITYKNSSKTRRAIAKELGVATVLEGGVRRAGNEIRINVQLINAQTGEQLWAESYTRSLSAKNIFAIQANIAHAIAAQLKAVLSPQEQKKISELPTQNLAALESYFLAKTSNNKATAQGYLQSIKHLEHAIALDPNFAIVYAELASHHLAQIYWSGAPPLDQIQKAQDYVQKALSLKPNLSEAYAALAELNEHQKHTQAADSAYQNAIKLNPNNASAYAAYGRFTLWVLNDVTRAFELFTQAKVLNPKDNGLSENLTQAQIRSGLFIDAQNLLNAIISSDPNFATAYRGLAEIEHIAFHRLAKSQQLLKKSIDLDPAVPINSMLHGLRYIDLNETALAIAWLKHALKLASTNRNADFTRAVIFELQEQNEQAFTAYLQVPYHSPTLNQALYNLRKLALHTQREAEAIEHFKTLYPELFLSHVKVDASNFIPAYCLGSLLTQTQGATHGEYLLRQSLTEAQKNHYGDWEGNHNNWQARVHMALGEHTLALTALNNFVEAGHYSAQHINDSDLQSLSQHPSFRENIQVLKSRLTLEREKLKLLLDDGTLGPPQ